jgi:hypothetical protein
VSISLKALAYAYAMRMAEHLGVAVTLARFRSDPPHFDEELADDKELTDDKAFKFKVGAVKDRSVRFEERDGGSKEELKTMGSLAKVSVFVVGWLPLAPLLVQRPDELEHGQEGSLST